MTLTLNLAKQLIPSPHLQSTQYLWLDITVALLSLSSMLLTFKYIYEVAFLYSEMQKNNTTTYKTAYDLQREAYAKIVEKNRSFH